MMDDLISRQAAIDALKGLLDSMLETDTIGFYEIENVLFELPSAQPERKKGKWIEELYRKMCCSECGTEALLGKDDAYYELTNFCPNCGADMRGGNND